MIIYIGADCQSSYLVKITNINKKLHQTISTINLKVFNNTDSHIKKQINRWNL